MKPNTAFFFGYGEDNFGEPRDINESLTINIKNYDGIGMALREGVDFKYYDQNIIRGTIFVDRDATARLEIKTVASCGTPMESHRLDLKAGKNSFNQILPVFTRSPLKEICIVILRGDNPKFLEGIFQILDLEFENFKN